MKIYGRITVYGEFLMHNDLQGLIMPSNLYLETTSEKNPTSYYNKQLDSILPLIRKRGITPPNTLKGNLPLGYGLAGSTLLGCLHLSHIRNSKWKKSFINEIDRKIHGFIPSGLDYESCKHQEWGLFCNVLGWKSILSPIEIDYTIIIFPKEGKLALSTVQKRVLSMKTTFNEIQQNLNDKINKYNNLDLELLTNYSKVLLSLGIYSEVANKFISTVMDKGYIAKTIGGLYDKAVIVVYNNYSKEDYLYIKKIASSLNGKILS